MHLFILSIIIAQWCYNYILLAYTPVQKHVPYVPNGQSNKRITLARFTYACVGFGGIFFYALRIFLLALSIKYIRMYVQ